MPRQVRIPCEELRLRYEVGESTTALARDYECSPATIAKRLRACGADLRSSRFRSIPVDEPTLRRLYLDEHLPVASIAAYFKVSISTIGNKRRSYGIPARSRH